VEEKVLVKEASKKLIPVPATYKKVSEKVLVTPAEKVWTTGATKKSGRVNASTLAGAVANGLNLGDAKIGNCYAEYHIPAQYKTETQQVLKSEASQKIEIPAKTQVVSREIKVTEESMQWRPILCETNMNSTLITDIQRALKKSGYNPGPIDGVIGHATMVAVDSFQLKNGLPRGGLTLRTLEKLGIRI